MSILLQRIVSACSLQDSSDGYFFSDPYTGKLVKTEHLCCSPMHQSQTTGRMVKAGRHKRACYTDRQTDTRVINDQQIVFIIGSSSLSHPTTSSPALSLFLLRSPLSPFPYPSLPPFCFISALYTLSSFPLPVSPSSIPTSLHTVNFLLYNPCPMVYPLELTVFSLNFSHYNNWALEVVTSHPHDDGTYDVTFMVRRVPNAHKMQATHTHSLQEEKQTDGWGRKHATSTQYQTKAAHPRQCTVS